MPLEQLKSPEDLERFLLDNEGIAPHDLVPLPSPYEDWKDDPIPELSEDQRERYEVGPDGVCALQVPVPTTEEERDQYVAAFLEGLRLIEQQWVATLTANGVLPIPAEPGSPLDPTVHRALLEQPSDQEPGTIVAEIVRGYRLHDRLLRESQVVVAAPPATDSPDDQPSETSGD